MTSTRLLHVTDTHLCPLTRKPESRSETFHEDIRNKFTSMVEMIKSEGVEAVLFSGDLCHLKNSPLYTPEHINYYQKMWNEIPVPIYGIPGNHDLQKSAFSNIEKTAYTAITNGVPNYIESAYEIHKLNSDINIHVGGIPYLPLKETVEALKFCNEAFPEDSYNILLLHTDALPTQDMPVLWETLKYTEVLEMIPNVNFVCLGHIHQAFPIYQAQGSTRPQIISKPWSFTRTAKDYHATSEVLETQHRPSVCLIDLINSEGKVNVKAQYRELNLRPFELAFVKEDLEREIQESLKFKSFLTQIKENYASVKTAFELENPEEVLGSLTLTEEIRETIEHYLN